jgi:hypothetical protein
LFLSAADLTSLPSPASTQAQIMSDSVTPCLTKLTVDDEDGGQLVGGTEKRLEGREGVEAAEQEEELDKKGGEQNRVTSVGPQRSML